MAAFWKRGLGMGLGAGLVGAALVALRWRGRSLPHPSLPEVISPSIFARRVQRTTRGQIVYHVSGEGDPLVFLHDFFPGAASYEWSKIYPAFASTHRVLAPDWIGFGESERPDRPLRAEDYAQSLHEFCRATCGGRRPVFVASGVGASIACLASAQHPEFAARMIFFHPQGTDSWASAWVPRSAGWAAWTRGGRRWIYRRFLAEPEALARRFEMRRSAGSQLDLAEPVSVCSSFARQYGAASALLRLLSGRFRIGALPRFEELCVPVTVWWPELSPVALPEALATRSAVRVDQLEGCGSLAPLDRADELCTLLRNELFSPVRVAEFDGN